MKALILSAEYDVVCDSIRVDRADGTSDHHRCGSTNSDTKRRDVFAKIMAEEGEGLEQYGLGLGPMGQAWVSCLRRPVWHG